MIEANITKEMACTFCGKFGDEVEVLIAGPYVFICDRCVDLCNDVVQEHRDKAVKAKD